MYKCEEMKTIQLPLYRKNRINKSNSDILHNHTIVDEHEAVKRGLTSYDKTMTNYLNFQYYSTLYVGENDHEMTFTYDTGSDYLWFPLNNCSGWQGSNLYTPTSTFSTNGTADGITYLDGSGYTGKPQISTIG